MEINESLPPTQYNQSGVVAEHLSDAHKHADLNVIEDETAKDQHLTVTAATGAHIAPTLDAVTDSLEPTEHVQAVTEETVLNDTEVTETPPEPPTITHPALLQAAVLFCYCHLDALRSAFITAVGDLSGVDDPLLPLPLWLHVLTEFGTSMGSTVDCACVLDGWEGGYIDSTSGAPMQMLGLREWSSLIHHKVSIYGIQPMQVAPASTGSHSPLISVHSGSFKSKLGGMDVLSRRDILSGGLIRQGSEMSVTNVNTQDTDVVDLVPAKRSLESVLRTYAKSLSILFLHYAYNQKKTSSGATFDFLSTKAVVVNKGEFLKCCKVW
jgi:hypothetical protein